MALVHAFSGRLMDEDWDCMLTGHGAPTLAGAKQARRAFLIKKQWPTVAHGSAQLVPSLASNVLPLARPLNTASSSPLTQTAPSDGGAVTMPTAPPQLEQGSVVVGQDFPNFEAESTSMGRINFYEFLGSSWGLLLTHTGAFLPVSTTEMAELAARYVDEFAARNCKVAVVSADSVEAHRAWVEDVLSFEQCKRANVKSLFFPVVADPTRELAKRLGVMDGRAKDASGLPELCRAAFLVTPDKKLVVAQMYASSVGRNFDELVRVLDSAQLTAAHGLVTPANWQRGQDVVVPARVAPAQAKRAYPAHRVVDAPSGKVYLRFVADPNVSGGA